MPKFNYDDYDEYYDDDYQSNFIKMKSKGKKKKSKGHQSKHQPREKYFVDDEEIYEPFIPEIAPTSLRQVTTPIIRPTAIVTVNPSVSDRKNNSQVNDNSSSQNSSTQSQNGHVFGPNTQEIKGFKIDFDGVANIEQVENELNGHMTFGIKFTFKGKKGLSKFIWYGTNQRMRDSVFTEKYLFWSKLPK